MKGTITLHNVPWLEMDVELNEHGKLSCTISDQSKATLADTISDMQSDIADMIKEAQQMNADTFSMQIYPSDSEEATIVPENNRLH